MYADGAGVGDLLTRVLRNVLDSDAAGRVR